MKYKYFEVNGYGVLGDSSAIINEGDYFYVKTDRIYGGTGIKKSLGNGEGCWKHNILTADSDEKGYHKSHCIKIVFAEKELNLDLPILPNWKEWEIEQLATRFFEDLEKINNVPKDYFKFPSNRNLVDKWITGYKANTAKYTKEDLKEAWELGAAYGTAEDNILPEAIEAQKDFIKYRHKIPTYIVMEYEDRIAFDANTVIGIEPKLIINSENKQEGIIKKIIY